MDGDTVGAVIGLVHYHVNDIGEIQTAAAEHGGLTEFGRQALREMNRVGILADLAHATFETTRDAAEVTLSIDCSVWSIWSASIMLVSAPIWMPTSDRSSQTIGSCHTCRMY